MPGSGDNDRGTDPCKDLGNVLGDQRLVLDDKDGLPEQRHGQSPQRLAPDRAGRSTTNAGMSASAVPAIWMDCGGQNSHLDDRRNATPALAGVEPNAARARAAEAPFFGNPLATLPERSFRPCTRFDNLDRSREIMLCSALEHGVLQDEACGLAHPHRHPELLALLDGKVDIFH